MKARSFDVLRGKMSAESRKRADAKAQRLFAELPLYELRTARRLSQEQVAAQLGIRQAAVSKIERRTDLYLSTLRRFVEAMGGELEINARFAEGLIRIQRLGELGEGRRGAR